MNVITELNDSKIDSSLIVHPQNGKDNTLNNILQNIYPTILYSNKNGTNGNIIFSQSISKEFKYIEIFGFNTNVSCPIYFKFPLFDNDFSRYLNLGGVLNKVGYNQIILWSKGYDLNDNSLNINENKPYREINFNYYSVSDPSWISNEDKNYITKIIVWK